MPVRNERIETIAADNHSWNAIDIGELSIVNPGKWLRGGDRTPDKVWVTGVEGGGGRAATISYQTFWSQNYDSTPGAPTEEGGESGPSQLDIERAVWEAEYGRNLSGTDGFAINITLIEFGVGYSVGDTISTYDQADKNGAELSLKIETGIDNGWALGSKVAGTPKAFWQNHYIRPTALNLTVRELRGLQQRKLAWGGDHKMMGVHGWQYIFSNNEPIDGYKKYGDNATDTSGLQLMNDKSIAGSTTVVFGNAEAHQFDNIQRWVLPMGVSFCWNNRHGRNDSKAKGLRLREMHLFFKFADEKIARSVHLIHNWDFVYKGQTYYNDHLKYYQDGVSRQGVVQAFMRPEDFSYLHEKNAKCIGTQIRYDYAKQTTQSDNVVNIFNYRFLFSEQSYPNSRMIIPSPAAMKNAERKGFHL